MIFYLLILDEAHKVFLSHAPNYEAVFDDFKKDVNKVDY